MRKALLALEDGTVYRGLSFGAVGERAGEVVFNTSMTGYQEILTDPSYAGQLVTMTYPMIGNYGVNKDDYESDKPQVSGFIIREGVGSYSNWRAEGSLEDWLRRHDVVGIQEIDTRALTKRIRTVGAMRGVISTIDLLPESLIEKALSAPHLLGMGLVKSVTAKEPYDWNSMGEQFVPGDAVGKGVEIATAPEKLKVVAIDFGIKKYILRMLEAYGCAVKVLPATAENAEIIAEKPDGVFLSNGPGDPEEADYAIETIKGLLGKTPIFGICLGHQLLALALGARTYKLKFGHRGGNQPVKNLRSGRVEITSQNHGYAVDERSLPKGVEVTHLNLNDHTNEGLVCRFAPAFSVQYHPEAGPGPHDSYYLFEQFTQLMRREKERHLQA